MKDQKSVEQGFVFWISHPLKWLSFHQEAAFERIYFVSHSEMWQKVHELVDQGYSVQ